MSAMFDPDEIAQRQAGFARQMSQRLNALAERVFVQAEAASEPEAVQAAALTVEKLYRGIRLCLGFEARVVRDHRRAGREDAAETLKVHETVRRQGIQRVQQAVTATFVADYEADCETSDDPDEDLRTLVRHLAALGDAVTGADSELDPSGDIAAQVEELRKAAILIAEINALDAPTAPVSPWRGRAASGLKWRGSG